MISGLIYIWITPGVEQYKEERIITDDGLFFSITQMYLKIILNSRRIDLDQFTVIIIGYLLFWYKGSNVVFYRTQVYVSNSAYRRTYPFGESVKL